MFTRLQSKLVCDGASVEAVRACACAGGRYIITSLLPLEYIS